MPWKVTWLSLCLILLQPQISHPLCLWDYTSNLSLPYQPLLWQLPESAKQWEYIGRCEQVRVQYIYILPQPVITGQHWPVITDEIPNEDTINCRGQLPSPKLKIMLMHLADAFKRLQYMHSLGMQPVTFMLLASWSMGWATYTHSTRAKQYWKKMAMFCFSAIQYIYIAI